MQIRKPLYFLDKTLENERSVLKIAAYLNAICAERKLAIRTGMKRNPHGSRGLDFNCSDHRPYASRGLSRRMARSRASLRGSSGFSAGATGLSRSVAKPLPKNFAQSPTDSGGSEVVIAPDPHCDMPSRRGRKSGQG
jgi:hypothetical protein